ncbi:16S rRNA (guanine(966)-N(2))-methyltransferase RsmD [Desulfosediminicola flagellatus]|uniref:16S rRNA (guanine(966)-N(2))-methyltransferase RsmD n=1 Tax=Desulfosediminicola flagellatus TaxID=2569541 RepID=UPI00142E9BBD|nr:16S rRNA (guanine(966)-N(2))-methyltransferase RsmD [Desulfosediminicola flagellatus]
MRIISGWAKGRRLFTPPGRTQTIRPTSDRAREALFNILGSRCENSTVLDLFTGTGALGLEALSRGANEVVLVDFHRQALDLAKRNIEACKPHPEGAAVHIIRHDLRKGLPPSLTNGSVIKKFDLIFLDPPYSKGLSVKILESISNSKLYSDHTLIVVEERSSESLPDQCGQLTLTDQRTYGDTGFWLYSPIQL